MVINSFIRVFLWSKILLTDSFLFCLVRLCAEKKAVFIFGNDVKKESVLKIYFIIKLSIFAIWNTLCVSWCIIIRIVKSIKICRKSFFHRFFFVVGGMNKWGLSQNWIKKKKAMHNSFIHSLLIKKKLLRIMYTLWNSACFLFFFRCLEFCLVVKMLFLFVFKSVALIKIKFISYKNYDDVVNKLFTILVNAFFMCLNRSGNETIVNQFCKRVATCMFCLFVCFVLFHLIS